MPEWVGFMLLVGVLTGLLGVAVMCVVALTEDDPFDEDKFDG